MHYTQALRYTTPRMIRFFRFLVLIACCAMLGESLYLVRKGFSLRRLQCLEKTYSDELSIEAETIVSQPFYYIGRGRQCFAFVSQDGRYVLKCPRTDIFKLSFSSRVLSSPSKRKAMIKGKTFRKNFVFNSFQLAKERLSEETGIIALHLGESKKREKTLTLIDPVGISFHLPIHKTIFILQHKHPLWASFFLEAKKKKEIQEQKRLLDALINTISRRAKKGILNRDTSFLGNYGFDGKRVYQIDVGDFFQKKTWDPHIVFHKSVEDSLKPVKEWLEKDHKEMLPFFEKRFSQLLEKSSSPILTDQ